MFSSHSLSLVLLLIIDVAIQVSAYCLVYNPGSKDYHILKAGKTYQNVYGNWGCERGPSGASGHHCYLNNKYDPDISCGVSDEISTGFVNVEDVCRPAGKNCP